ncbi:hypothetical protein CKO15_09415 [Halorhodospira abdelmalekii]|uniref:ZapG family protein n=1 Tax=Halorhodospira abdelmalekii TaxID=421629 RepID=UPI0019083E30|nr:DUF1043 family protein [Halorhodospira abdelmalekii]MBK1735497.1 hypothetical protein [Halorhodospira abdelmalekii]
MLHDPLLYIAVGLAVGGAAGALFGRSMGPNAQDVRDADRIAKQKRDEAEAVRREVDSHFEQTAQIMGEVTKAYRKLYEHMAKSTQRLAPRRTEDLVKSLGDQRLLPREISSRREIRNDSSRRGR